MIYDLIIIGAGPVGLACSVYASRFKINHLIIGQILGGTITEAFLVENYPGFKSISGAELGKRFLEHAKSYGVRIVEKEVIEIQNLAIQSVFKLVTADGESFQAKTLFLGLGTRVRRLDIPGEKSFLGRGVSYCTTCDAPLFKDKTVVVIGGGNSAVTAALHLCEFAKKVYLVHRGEELRAEPVWQERLFSNPKIKVIFKANVVEIKGNGFVKAVLLDDERKLEVEGVFVEIGTVPATELVKDLGLEFEEGGLIKINPDGSTNVPGVYAGGDIASAMKGMEPRQVVTAVSEGAQAAMSIYKSLKRKAKS